jgi:hypothetical protein
VEEKAYLVLGCYGRTENGFVLCSSTQNRVLKLDDSLVNIEGVMNYFDAVKLFDRPMLDQNAIRHLIYHLQDRFDQKFKRMWNDHEYHLLERFIQMHKPCGLYVQLIMVQDSGLSPGFVDELNGRQDISFVRGVPESHKKERKVIPDFVRNRKN